MAKRHLLSIKQFQLTPSVELKMSSYDNMFQRPTSLFFPSSTKFGSGNMGGLNNPSIMIDGSSMSGQGAMIGAGANHLAMNDVFSDEQEDQIVPDCSVAPKLDLSPMNEPWMNGSVGASGLPSGSDASCASHGFLSTAVQLSLQEVCY